MASKEINRREQQEREEDDIFDLIGERGAKRIRLELCPERSDHCSSSSNGVFVTRVRDVQKKYEEDILSVFEGKPAKTEFKALIHATDFIGVSRSKLYEDILSDLREQFKANIENIDSVAMNELLEQSIAFIDVKELQPVPYTILCQHKEIPIHLLNRVMKNHESFFRTLPHRLQSRGERGCTRQDVESAVSKIVRRANEADIDTLDHVEEYRHLIQTTREMKESREMFATIVREMFVRSTDDSLCTLRNEVMTAIEERDTATPSEGAGASSPCAALRKQLIRTLRQGRIATYSSSSVGCLRSLFSIPTVVHDPNFPGKIVRERVDPIVRPVIEWSRKIATHEKEVRNVDAKVACPPSKGRLKAIVTRARELDASRIFEDDPLLVVPGYGSVISTPMWLKRVEAKIERGEYTSVRHFRADVELIETNCLKFNRKVPFFVNYAKKMYGQLRPILDGLQSECARLESERRDALLRALPVPPHLSKEFARTFAGVCLTLGDPRVLDAVVSFAISRCWDDFRTILSAKQGTVPPILNDAEFVIVSLGERALDVCESGSLDASAAAGTPCWLRFSPRDDTASGSNSTEESLARMIAADARDSRDRHHTANGETASLLKLGIDVTKSSVARRILAVYTILCARRGQAERLKHVLKGLFLKYRDTDFTSGDTKRVATRCFLVRHKRFVVNLVNECCQVLASGTNARVVEVVADHFLDVLLETSFRSVRLIIHDNLSRMLLRCVSSESSIARTNVDNWTTQALDIWESVVEETRSDDFTSSRANYASVLERFPALKARFAPVLRE